MSDVLFTRFTSETVLAKVISKGADGSLVKKASAQFYAGSFETVRVPVESPGTAPRLVSVLQTFTRHQALSPSLSLGAESGKITTEARPLPHAVTRTKKNFGYRPDELGLLVLDYDPPKGSTPLTPDELKHRLFTIWPEAARGIVVHWFSGSSLIFDGDKQLAPATGQRMYVALNSQAAIPETIKALNKLAWLLGLGGHVHISKIGSLLVRGLFDSAMADAGGR